MGINLEIAHCLREFTKDFSKFSNLWGRISQALATIQVAPEVQDGPEAKPLVVTPGGIIFDKVKFHYKGAKPLFKNKSVTIELGQKVVLVGYSERFPYSNA